MPLYRPGAVIHKKVNRPARNLRIPGTAEPAELIDVSISLIGTTLPFTVNKNAECSSGFDGIFAEFPDADVVIAETRGLCTYYAEKGGLMIGFEVN